MKLTAHSHRCLCLPEDLFMAMAQIDSREELSEGATFRITAREYAFIADIDVTVPGS